MQESCRNTGAGSRNHELGTIPNYLQLRVWQFRQIGVKMARVMIMDHPLIQHKINYIRREDIGSKEFREIVSEIASLMCYEASRDLKLQSV